MGKFRSGDRANTKTHTRQETLVDGSIIEETTRKEAGVITRTRRVLVDRNVWSKATPELKAYLRKYADAAEGAGADAVLAHRKEQRRAHRLLREAKAAESSRSRVV